MSACVVASKCSSCGFLSTTEWQFTTSTLSEMSSRCFWLRWIICGSLLLLKLWRVNPSTVRDAVEAGNKLSCRCCWLLDWSFSQVGLGDVAVKAYVVICLVMIEWLILHTENLHPVFKFSSKGIKLFNLHSCLFNLTQCSTTEKQPDMSINSKRCDKT